MNAKEQFIEWLKKNDPFLYQLAMRRAMYKDAKSKPGLSGIFDSIGNAFSNIADTVLKVGPKYYEMRTQKEILEAQLKQAQAGQPPLNISYPPVVPPQQVNTAPVQQEIDTVAKESTESKLPAAVPLAIGAFFLSRMF